MTNIAPRARNSKPIRDRAFWRIEARRSHTDWSSLLRQRIRVRAWVKRRRHRR
jgi:hypothetical protein